MIDYKILADSVEFYEARGYQRIEAPWLVTKAINDITCPPGATKYYVTKNGRQKTFVASGEQSFLYLINKGFLPKSGKFQTITPCMRDDEFDAIHTKYFLKNELIVYGPDVDDKMVSAVMADASNFFQTYVTEKDIGFCITKDHGDLLLNGVEVGSYGLRECEFVKWVYGTGVAEPRFSRLLEYK